VVRLNKLCSIRSTSCARDKYGSREPDFKPGNEGERITQTKGESSIGGVHQTMVDKRTAVGVWHVRCKVLKKKEKKKIERKACQKPIRRTR